ncbi:hypothetical protein BDI01nite_14360 [Brevundimonas diminuta]|nr:hypothetical protein BDI01nite_14360 [Brevundimonas diminuta]
MLDVPGRHLERAGRRRRRHAGACGQENGGAQGQGDLDLHSRTPKRDLSRRKAWNRSSIKDREFAAFRSAHIAALRRCVDPQPVGRKPDGWWLRLLSPSIPKGY